METWEIGGHVLEFDEEIHEYYVDGIIVPSVTQILKKRFGRKYDFVDYGVLKKASEEGTKTHKIIEDYFTKGIRAESKELNNLLFLQKHYQFEVLQNEIPVILSRFDLPICAGRLDMVLQIGNLKGLGDIKRVSALDKEYVGLQLNIYRLAYEQTYNESIDFLKAIHLRNDTRKFVEIPVNESYAWDCINEYLEGKE